MAKWAVVLGLILVGSFINSCGSTNTPSKPITAAPTETPTSLSTATNTSTSVYSWTPTSTGTWTPNLNSPTPTITWTGTPTKTSTPTRTSTSTPFSTPTPTPTQMDMITTISFMTFSGVPACGSNTNPFYQTTVISPCGVSMYGSQTGSYSAGVTGNYFTVKGCAFSAVQYLDLSQFCSGSGGIGNIQLSVIQNGSTVTSPGIGFIYNPFIVNPSKATIKIGGVGGGITYQPTVTYQ